MRAHDRIQPVGVSSSGELWAIIDGGLFRRVGERWQSVPVSLGYESGVRKIAGIEHGDVRAVSMKGLVRFNTVDPKPEPVTIPLPPFAAIKKPPTVESINVIAPGDAWVNVTYGTKYEGVERVETRRALLRAKPVRETLRCRERQNHDGSEFDRGGAESWPPRATPTCTTPAVVLGRGVLDAAAFPRTRALLKGQKAFGDTMDLYEVNTSTPPYVVARVASYEIAEKLASYMGKKVRFGAVPELVCTKLEALPGHVRVDLETGEVVSK